MYLCGTSAAMRNIRAPYMQMAGASILAIRAIWWTLEEGCYTYYKAYRPADF